MPDDPEIPPPVPVPMRAPSAPGARAPVPGWMWLLFTVGPVVGGALVGGVGAFGHHDMLDATLLGGLCGAIFALPLAGGLALAGRFFGTTAGRIAGGLMFTGLLLVGLGAVGFAGCLCLMQQGSGGWH